MCMGNGIKQVGEGWRQPCKGAGGRRKGRELSWRGKSLVKPRAVAEQD